MNDVKKIDTKKDFGFFKYFTLLEIQPSGMFLVRKKHISTLCTIYYHV